MSYILEALKKKQARMRRDEVALSTATPRHGRLPPWIFATLAIALAANGALLLWIFVFDDVEPPAQHQTALNNPASNAVQIESLPTQPSSPASGQAVEAPTQQTRAREASANQAPPNAVPPLQPSTSPTPTVGQNAPAQALQTYTLDDLASDERQFFVDFKYTSHIYTDDQSLCAIVVNGERLQSGSRFSGLVVNEITPEGVVFEQSTASGKRLVAISLIEQWRY